MGESLLFGFQLLPSVPILFYDAIQYPDTQHITEVDSQAHVLLSPTTSIRQMVGPNWITLKNIHHYRYFLNTEKS